MKITNKSTNQMNVEELVEELMARFRDIHQQLNIIEVQTSHQNKKILHLENKFNSIKTLTGKGSSHQISSRVAI